ncbi:MAG: FG-GAP repeat domain-containing protein [Myxococcota bacterium]
MVLLLVACVGEPDAGEPSEREARDCAGPAKDGEGEPGALATEPSWRGEGARYGTGLAIADFDCDGAWDVAIAPGNDMEREALRVYAGFAEAPTWEAETGHFYGHLSAGDLDGDGDADLAAARYLGDGGFGDPGAVEVWRNDDGAFTRAWLGDPVHAFSVDLGDVDDDGDLDLAATAGEPYAGEPAGDRVYANDGAGAFTLVWEGDPRLSLDVALADVDGDGALDVALAGTPSAVYSGGALAWEGGAGGLSVDVGDVDGDGADDLVIAENASLGGAGGWTAWCAGEPCAGADAPADASAVSVHDADGDGLAEVFVGGWWAGVRATDGWAAGGEAVVEALAWVDLDGSHTVSREATFSGRGPHLLGDPVDAAIVEADGARVTAYSLKRGRLVLRDDAREVVVRWRAPAGEDLVVTDWEPDGPDVVYGRER